jgi:hypothetical protein
LVKFVDGFVTDELRLVMATWPLVNIGDGDVTGEITSVIAT